MQLDRTRIIFIAIIAATLLIVCGVIVLTPFLPLWPSLSHR
jgi:hypothetical protein